jgi:hypothetical protein
MRLRPTAGSVLKTFKLWSKRIASTAMVVRDCAHVPPTAHYIAQWKQRPELAVDLTPIPAIPNRSSGTRSFGPIAPSRRSGYDFVESCARPRHSSCEDPPRERDRRTGSGRALGPEGRTAVMRDPVVEPDVAPPLPAPHLHSSVLDSEQFIQTIPIHNTGGSMMNSSWPP